LRASGFISGWPQPISSAPPRCADAFFGKRLSRFNHWTAGGVLAEKLYSEQSARPGTCQTRMAENRLRASRLMSRSPNFGEIHG